MLKILLLSLVLIGCGIEERETKKPELPPIDYGKYSSYVNEFLGYAYDAGINIQNLQVSKLRLITTVEKEVANEYDMGKYTIGVCQKKTYNTILLRKEFDATAKPALKKWAIFHELGHCIFNAAHPEDDKTALMSSHVPYEVYIAKDDTIVVNAVRNFMADFVTNRLPLESLADQSQFEPVLIH
jgi:hypothetical protein